MTTSRSIWMTSIALGFVPTVLLAIVLFSTGRDWGDIIITSLFVWFCIAAVRAYSMRGALHTKEARTHHRESSH